MYNMAPLYLFLMTCRYIMDALGLHIIKKKLGNSPFSVLSNLQSLCSILFPSFLSSTRISYRKRLLMISFSRVRQFIYLFLLRYSFRYVYNSFHKLFFMVVPAGRYTKFYCDYKKTGEI